MNPDDLFGEPLFDLSCNAQNDDDDEEDSSSTVSSASASATSEEASRTPTDTSFANPTTLTMDVPVYSTPSGSRPATLTPISTSSLTTVISDDVMVSTVGGTGAVATSYPTPSSGNGTVPGGQAPVPQTTMPVGYEGGAARPVGGIAAVVLGMAAWVL